MKNYIGNNNEINKKKYKKSLPPKLNTNAGNVEYNINMFNRAADVGDAPSSAEGMSGMAEAYDRDSLITRIIEFGKHYNFDKYTDAQLNAMLNRLVDAENHRKRVLPRHQDKINIQSSRHTMNDDPSYNFDDPEREGEYRVENLREALNKLDHYCIDNDKRFHDLRSLYENIAHTLSSQEKTELKNLLNTTNDPDAVKAYLDSKDPDKKQDEELKEDKKGITFEELMKLAVRYYMQGGSEIIEFWDKNSFDEYEKEFGPMSRETAIKLMKTMKAVTDDELEAGRYWSKDTVESYSVKSNSTTDSVDVIDDETNQVVSRHRGENALDDANHEKDVMNMNEDFDPFDTYSLQDKIYDFLYFLIDDMNYEEMISEVSDEFGMSPDEAEKYVKAYINDSEVEWHDTADLEEDYDDYKSWTIEDRRKYKRLLIINNEGGNSAFDLEQLVKKYQPSAEDMEDLTKETIQKVYNELKDMYTKELQRYGKDHEVDLVALQALGLTGLEKKLAKEDLQESTQTVYGVQYYENKLGKWITYDYSSDKERIEYSYDQPIAGNPAKRMVELEISGTRKKKFKVLKTLKQTKNTWESLNRENKRVVAYTPKDLEEDYTKADDEWGNPYTLDEVFDQLKELTNDFTDKDGTVRCWYEQEKIYGVKVLKKYYNVVEVSDGRMSNEEDMSWVIAYSDPKETRKKR